MHAAEQSDIGVVPKKEPNKTACSPRRGGGSGGKNIRDGHVNMLFSFCYLCFLRRRSHRSGRNCRVADPHAFGASSTGILARGSWGRKSKIRSQNTGVRSQKEKGRAGKPRPLLLISAISLKQSFVRCSLSVDTYCFRQVKTKRC
jgi:hypothetical protein